VIDAEEIVTVNMVLSLLFLLLILILLLIVHDIHFLVAYELGVLNEYRARLRKLLGMRLEAEMMTKSLRRTARVGEEDIIRIAKEEEEGGGRTGEEEGAVWTWASFSHSRERLRERSRLLGESFIGTRSFFGPSSKPHTNITNEYIISNINNIFMQVGPWRGNSRRH